MKLITGVTGLVGSHLALELLKTEPKIIAIKRKSTNTELVKKTFSYYLPQQKVQEFFGKIEWREADLLNTYELYEAMDGVDEVYHCAGLITYDPRDKYRVFEVNVQGTANTVNAAIERKIKKFIYVSSVASLGSKTDDEEIDEETYAVPAEKYSFYSKSKYYAEMQVWRGQEEGLNIVIVNPSVILGPPADWKRKLIGKMFIQIWRGLPFYIDGVLGYVDVRDVVKAMIELANREIYGHRFIVNAANLSYYEIFSMVADALEKPRPKYKVSPAVFRAIYGLDKIRTFVTNSKALITKDMIKYIGTKLYYSNTKLLQFVPGFEYIPISETIKFMAKIFERELEPQQLHKESFLLNL